MLGHLFACVSFLDRCRTYVDKGRNEIEDFSYTICFHDQDNRMLGIVDKIRQNPYAILVAIGLTNMRSENTNQFRVLGGTSLVCV